MKKTMSIMLLLISTFVYSSDINNSDIPTFDVLGYDFEKINKISNRQYSLKYNYFNGGTYFNVYLNKHNNNWTVSHVYGVDYCPNCSPKKRIKKCKYLLNMPILKAKIYIESDEFIQNLFPDMTNKQSQSKCKNYYSE